MTEKEKLEAIKAEIERLFNFAKGYYADRIASGYKICCNDIISFINSLPEEPVSEDLEEAANNAVIALVPSFGQKYSDGSYVSSCRDSFKREELLGLFKAGAKWQKERIMANSTNATIGLPYENKDGGYTHLIDVSRPLSVGNNIIAIIFKED